MIPLFLDAMRFKSSVPNTLALAAGAAALTLLWTEAARAQAGHDPTWSPALHLASTATIPVRMRQPVLQGANRLRLTNGTTVRAIGNCSEYLAAVGKGFGPSTNYDAKVSGEFVHECFALRDLQHARSATSARAYHWSGASLTQLPPVLVPGAREVTDAAEEAEKRGASWKQADSAVRVTKVSGDQLLAEDANYVYSLDIIARADFNGDGVEDLAVYGAAQGKHSTWADARYFIFSPTSSDKLVRLTDNRAPFHMLATRSPASPGGR